MRTTPSITAGIWQEFCAQPESTPGARVGRRHHTLPNEYDCGVDHNPNAKPNLPVHVTKGHEAQARETQLRKPPSRFGLWVLRRLGYRGAIREPAPQAPSHFRTSIQSRVLVRTDRASVVA